MVMLQVRVQSPVVCPPSALLSALTAASMLYWLSLSEAPPGWTMTVSCTGVPPARSMLLGTGRPRVNVC